MELEENWWEQYRRTQKENRNKPQYYSLSDFLTDEELEEEFQKSQKSIDEYKSQKRRKCSISNEKRMRAEIAWEKGGDKERGISLDNYINYMYTAPDNAIDYAIRNGFITPKVEKIKSKNNEIRPIYDIVGYDKKDIPIIHRVIIENKTDDLEL